MRHCISLLAVNVSLFAAPALCAENFPERPLRIVTPGVGGSADFVARVIAQGLTTSFGQQVIVDNRPNGIIVIDMVIKAPPDGYTLLNYASTVWLMPFLRDNVNYDPVKDLAPITLVVDAPNVVVVPQSLAAKSIKELIALAKAKPGQLNYATTGTGNATHLAGELFNRMAGVDIVRVNYKTPSVGFSDLFSGQVQVMFGTAGSVTPHIKSGRLRALAVTGATPSALFPDLPTVAASGLPGYEAGTVSGMFAPGRTPARLIQKLNQEIVRVLNRPEVRKAMLENGVEPVGSTSQEFAARIKAEMNKWGQLIRSAGIRED